MAYFNVSIKIIYSKEQNYGNLLCIWSACSMDNQLVKLVSVGTIFLLTLVGILPTMDSVKNGFQGLI